MGFARSHRRLGYLLAAALMVSPAAARAQPADQGNQPVLAPPALAAAMARYRRDLAAYMQAQASYAAAAEAYWSVIAEKRHLRAAKRASHEPISLGDYVLTQVPAGKYEVSITVPCCDYNPYTRPDVSVEAGRKVQLDIRLEEGTSYRTVGDDPAAVADLMRSRAKVPSAPAPRMPDGKPDLSGVWTGNDDLYPEQPELLPWAEALVKERIANNFRDAPGGKCLPAGPLVTGPFLVKLVQTPSLL